MSPSFEQITILGPGLLGGSLMAAARERGLAGRLHAWSRRAETRARCASQPWCDAVLPTPSEAVAGAGLVVICTPVEHIVPLLAAIAPALAPEALVTDVGSTKSLIARHGVAALAEAGRGDVSFIGSHPMAGSEKTGLENATAELFEGRVCFLTPLTGTPAPALDRLAAFWRAAGMEVVTASPEEHDEVAAHVSHLPHALASVLCAFLAGRDPGWRNLAGAGLRDTTRIAAGDPALWRSIFSQNREEVLRALDGFEAELQRFRAALHNGDDLGVRSLLERGQAYRNALRPGGHSG